MNNVERYEELIKLALEAQQLKIELRSKLLKISNNITAKELKHRIFDNEDATKALAILSPILKIEKSQYNKSIAKFKNVEIYLHVKPDKLDGKAMAHILEDLSTNEIFV